MTQSNPVSESRINSEEVGSVPERAHTLCVNTPKGITLLPANFFTTSKKTDLKFQSHALDVKALLKQEGLPVAMVEVEGIKIPFVEDRDATWVGPIIFFSAAVLSENPNVIAVALNVLSNYIYHFFKGKEGRKNVLLSLIVEKKGKEKTVKFDYEGPPEGMLNIEKVINNVLK